MNGSRYLILACLIVDNPAPLDRLIKRMRKNKFRRILRHVEEIKGYSASSDMISYVVKNISSIDSAFVHYIVLEKGRLYSQYLRNHCHKMYNYVAGQLAHNLHLDGYDLEIRIDKSKGKRLLRDDFDNYFKMKLQKNSSIRKITLQHSYSHSWSGIQIVDVLAYACFQRFEHGNPEFLDLLDIDKREINTVF